MLWWIDPSQSRRVGKSENDSPFNRCQALRVVEIRFHRLFNRETTISQSFWHGTCSVPDRGRGDVGRLYPIHFRNMPLLHAIMKRDMKGYAISGVDEMLLIFKRNQTVMDYVVKSEESRLWNGINTIQTVKASDNGNGEPGIAEIKERCPPRAHQLPRSRECPSRGACLKHAAAAELSKAGR